MPKPSDSDDRVLDALRSFANGAEVAFGTSITVLAGPARIEGVIANSGVYSEHLGDKLHAAFIERAEAAGDDPERSVAAGLAEGFSSERYAATNERRRTRRQEIAQRLRELDEDADDAEAHDLGEEESLLADLGGPILILRDSRVWGPGFNPLSGPSEVAFVRVRVAEIAAWWVGESSRAD